VPTECKVLWRLKIQSSTTSPIIIKDNYEVSGSDMAQIGWVEVTTENGATGYLWYIKSEHETRLRFEDYLEMSMIEGVPAEARFWRYRTVTGDVGQTEWYRRFVLHN
jgi:hypothetical protein